MTPVSRQKRTCHKCQKKFQEKDIYTIQQFQYRKTPDYSWSIQYFAKFNIDEWTPLCEGCINLLKAESHEEYLKHKT